MSSSNILLLVAILSAACTLSMYVPRRHRTVTGSFGLFAISMLTTELAPLWLLVQGVVVLLLVACGGLESGFLSLAILTCSWLGMLSGISKMLKTEEVVNASLTTSLGESYLDDIPENRRKELEQGISLKDVFNPLGFGKKDYDLISNVNYLPGGFRNQLDIYCPKNMPAEGAPVLMLIHGGAWKLGQKGQQAVALTRLMTRHGWVVVDINYRLSPEVFMPAHTQDCKAALCWIRENGSEYGMNTDFVAVMGGSAGGQLSSILGVSENEPALQPGKEHVDTSVQAAVPFYGPHDMASESNRVPNAHVARHWLTGVVLEKSLEQDPLVWRMVSPLSHVNEEAPPYMVVHGGSDSVVAIEHSRVFVEALGKKSKNPVVYTELPGADHAFDFVNSIRTRHTVNGVHRFLEWAKAKHEAKAK